MGLSTSTSKTTPVYSKELTGAAGSVTNAYNAQAPKITGITDQMGSLVPGLMQDYQKGDPNVNAAGQFNQDVLGGKYLNSNPYFDSTVQRASNDIANQTSSQLGVHGNWGNSSSMADIVSRNVGANENAMRSGNYQYGLGMMSNAAAQAPGLAEARYLPINAMGSIAEAQQMPLQAASGMGNSIGGLLGQYTNVKQKQGAGGLLAGLAGSALSGWASGGFRPIRL